MTRIRILTLTSAAALILFAAACGGGDESSSADDTTAAGTTEAAATVATTEATETATEATETATEPTETVAGAVPASEWVGTVCGAVSSWQDVLTSGAADLQQASDPVEAKQLVSDYLQEVVDATDAMIDEIASAGAPDVDQGEEIAADFQTALGSLRDSYEQARSEVESLSTDDTQALGQGLESVGASLANAGVEAGQAFDQISEEYPGAALDETAASEPACSSIAG